MTRSHDGVVGHDVEIAELTAAMCDPKAAVTQIRSDTPGRVSFDKKITERKTNQVALRSLKRRISRAVYRRLLTDQQTNTRSGPAKT